jgi:hypothetical protein
MKLCKCGCETEISENNNWEYKRGHKPGGGKKKKKKKGSTPRTPRAKPESADVDMVTLSIDLTEERLNQMWGKLDIGSKGAAIQHVLLIEE